MIAGLAIATAATAFVGVAAGASPTSGSIAGPVTSTSGGTFVVKTSLSPTGSSKVHVTGKTVINAQVKASRSALRKGTCVMATGQRDKKGVVAATRISITQAVDGRCGGGFGPGGGQRPSPPSGNLPQPPSGGAGQPSFGGAFGAITKIKGATFTVKGPFGTTTVRISSKTQLTRMQRVGSSAIKVKQCAFVFGTSSDKGVNVNAQSVSLSQPTSSGCSGPRPGR